jgi:hypothetical protein
MYRESVSGGGEAHAETSFPKSNPPSSLKKEKQISEKKKKQISKPCSLIEP